MDAGRRRGPGSTELHERTTDVIYVLEGTATVLTGADGDPTSLSAGDVFVVPAGVAHAFATTSDPFRYLVVKVEQ